jgi:hypothetical protein
LRIPVAAAEVGSGLEVLTNGLHRDFAAFLVRPCAMNAISADVVHVFGVEA